MVPSVLTVIPNPANAKEAAYDQYNSDIYMKNKVGGKCTWNHECEQP